jgi:molybdopterin/thiamine biosynthesis adenylyltransferase
VPADTLLDDHRPALRPSALLADHGDDVVQVILTSSSTVKHFAVDAMTKALLPLLDGTRTVTDLDDALGSVPGYSATHLRDVLSFMDDERLLRPRPAADVAGFGADELERYDRQLLLLEDLAVDHLPGTTGLGLQDRLRSATVVVIGAGGTGGWLLSSLAASGVGRLRVCDFDRVEPSNLNRQILYRHDDVGRPKVHAAVESLHRLNPHVAVEGWPLRMRGADDLDEVVRGADLVVNCADRPDVLTTAGWVADACTPRGTAHIVGGAYASAVGTVGMTILPGRSPCWRCARRHTADDHDRSAGTPLKGRTGPGAGIAMVSAVVANVIAWEALRVVIGLPSLLAGHWTELDLASLQIRRRPIPADAGCPCSTTTSDHQTGGPR